VIATSGGYDEVEERWEHLRFLPYELLRHKWQWHLMDTFRKTLATDEIRVIQFSDMGLHNRSKMS
jgi:hypothetical protein